jgi:nitrite reductase/ring-hydroxylating ferredoxin subunit
MTDEQGLEWHRVAQLGDIVEDEPKGVRVGRNLIALYNIGGKIYATDNVCTHEFAELSDGFVDGDVVECPLHQARFHIPTGKVVAPPATEDLPVFPVRVDGDDVLVGLPKK